jgi:hypothetical protein
VDGLVEQLSGIPVTYPHDQDEACFTLFCLVTVPWITFRTIRWLITRRLEFRPVLFPIDGFNDPSGRGIVPIR